MIKNILICTLKALIATILTVLGLMTVIKFGLWFFKLSPAVGMLILFVVAIFAIYFELFYRKEINNE